MREKYEVELKKEIKKLQRIRDMMRAAHNNPDMKEKQRYLEARKRIEVVSVSNKYRIQIL
jgi:CCR4-NOT transcription complex subunit 3